MHTLTAETAGGTASMTFNVVQVPTDLPGYMQYAQVAFDQVARGTGLELCMLLSRFREDLDASLPLSSNAAANMRDKSLKKQVRSTKKGAFDIIRSLSTLLRDKMDALIPVLGADAVQAAVDQVHSLADQSRGRINTVRDTLMLRWGYFLVLQEFVWILAKPQPKCE